MQKYYDIWHERVIAELGDTPLDAWASEYVLNTMGLTHIEGTVLWSLVLHRGLLGKAWLATGLPQRVFVSSIHTLDERNLVYREKESEAPVSKQVPLWLDVGYVADDDEFQVPLREGEPELVIRPFTHVLMAALASYRSVPAGVAACYTLVNGGGAPSKALYAGCGKLAAVCGSGKAAAYFILEQTLKGNTTLSGLIAAAKVTYTDGRNNEYVQSLRKEARNK